MLNLATSEVISSPFVNVRPGRRKNRQRSRARFSHRSQSSGSSITLFSVCVVAVAVGALEDVQRTGCRR